MGFDPKEYRKRVLSRYTRSGASALGAALREMRGDPALLFPSRLDLADLYDVTPPLGPDLGDHVDAVAGAFRAAERIGGGNPHPRELHDLLQARNSDFRTSAFWTAALARSTARADADLSRFAEEVGRELAGLGVVTMPDLRAVATGSGVGPGVDDAVLIEAVAAVGVAVVPPFPVVSAPAQRLREIKTGLGKTAGRSVLSAVFLSAGEPASFSLVDGFSSDVVGLALDLRAVSDSYAHAERLGTSDENDAYRKVLGAVRAAVTTDAELLALVISSFVETGRDIVKAGGTRRGQLETFVEQTGIARVDAGRILLRLQPQASGNAPSWSDVLSLVAAGSVKQARRAYLSLSGRVAGSSSPEQQAAERSLSYAEERVEALRTVAKDAVTAGDLEAAARAYDEALTLCADDETLSAAARALPPAAPLRAVAVVSEDGSRVRLTWEPGYGSTDDVVYQVVRRVGSAPRNNLDGSVLASGLRTPGFEDTEPRVAEQAWYGIAASRGGGASPVAVADALALPPVGDVVATTDPTSITLRWTTPRAASRIEVLRIDSDGSEHHVPLDGPSATTVSDVRTGAAHTFLLTALYAASDGSTMRSSTERVTAVPRGTAAPVTSLSLEARPADRDLPVVAAAWPTVPGFDVEVWHADRPWDRVLGDRIPMAEIGRTAELLAGRSISAPPGRAALEGVTKGGLRHYLAVTRDGDVGVVGAAKVFGSAPAVRNVHVERFGAEVVISWDWPGPTFDVEVTWDGPAGGRRLLAASEYRSEGGCRVSLGSAGGHVSLCSVTSDPTGDVAWRSPSVELDVPGVSGEVPYDVRFRRRLAGPPRGATVRFTPDRGASFEVVVVASFSRFMPFDPTQGAVVSRSAVSGDAPEVEVELPRGKGTVWVRAFASTPGIRLIDPSPARMKVE